MSEESEETKPKSVRYRLLTDVRYNGKTVKAGKTVGDLPEGSLKWLLLRGHIRKVK